MTRIESLEKQLAEMAAAADSPDANLAYITSMDYLRAKHHIEGQIRRQRELDALNKALHPHAADAYDASQI